MKKKGKATIFCDICGDSVKRKDIYILGDREVCKRCGDAQDMKRWKGMKFIDIDGHYTGNDGEAEDNEGFKDYKCAIPVTKWQEDHILAYPGDEDIYYYFDKTDEKKLRAGKFKNLGGDFVIDKVSEIYTED